MILENDLERIKKILIIQFRPFGDVLLATSYLEALQERLPQASIDFLVKKPFQEVLTKHPYLSEVLAFEQGRGIQYLTGRIRLFFKIRRRKYDLVIDQQHGTGSGQVVLTCGARHKLGWSHGKWPWIYNLKAVWGPVRYRAFQNYDMLSPLGVEERTPKFFYHIEPESEDYIKAWLKRQNLLPEEIILISPGSPRKKKKWHPSLYAELSDLIQAHTKLKVVLLQGPNEHEDCRKVMAESRHGPIMAPSTTFNQAAALLKNCKLLICNDGGLNHLSVALGVPSLAIFGNTPPERWSPQGQIPHHFHLHNPAWKKNSDNRFGITPQEAFQKVREILAVI